MTNHVNDIGFKNNVISPRVDSRTGLVSDFKNTTATIWQSFNVSEALTCMHFNIRSINKNFDEFELF